MLSAFLVNLISATAPQATESQLLDVDGTVFVMLGLFVLALAVLTPLLWKPYIRIKGERTTKVEGYRAQAEQMEVDAKARFEKVEKQLAEARREGAGALAVARVQAHSREQTLLAHAHTQAQATLAEAKAKLEAAMAAQKANLDQKAEALGREAAAKVLGRSVS